MSDHQSNGADTFLAPHPEGQVYDPEGYAALVSERNSSNRLFMWIGLVSFAAIGVSCMGGMLSRGENNGFIWGTVASIAFVANIIAANVSASRYRERLSAHQLKVAQKKDFATREQSAALARTQSTAAEAKNMLATQLRKSPVVNNVTLNFSNGSHFTGPLVVGENITVSYSAIQNANGAVLKAALERLVKVSTPLIEKIADPQQKIKASEQLKTLAEQASNPKPSKWLTEISGKGLIEAAKSVAEMAGPVTAAVKTVLALIASAA